MKQGELRDQRHFDRMLNISTDVMQPHELAGVDMQSYMDLVKVGLNPWDYTFKMTDGVLRAYLHETAEVLYTYDPARCTWA